MNALDEMDEALVAFSVHIGFATERSAMARKLLHEGVSAADVELLGRHCEATVDGEANAVRVLVALLQDHAKRDERLADLRAKRQIRARIDGALPFGDKPTRPGPMQDETRQDWERDRRCQIAFCRVVADRADKVAVANDLGVPVAELADMVKRGRELQHARDRQSVSEPEPEESHEDRVKRFVELVRQRRAAGAS